MVIDGIQRQAIANCGLRLRYRKKYDKEFMAFLIEKAEMFSEDTMQVTMNQWKYSCQEQTRAGGQACRGMAGWD